LWNPPNPAYGALLKELEAAAEPMGVKLQRLEVRAPEDLEAAFKAASRQRAGAIVVPGDPLITNRPKMVADLALKYGLPTITDFRELPTYGGLLSFGPDLVDSYRRAARHVDKILKGAKVGDVPMEQPTKFELVINLKTAKTVMPPSGRRPRPSLRVQATRGQPSSFNSKTAASRSQYGSATKPVPRSTRFVTGVFG
jgi:putative ABC transport system substrate-binding protein